MPDFRQNSPKFAGIQNPDASGSIRDASGTHPGRIRHWYQFRRSLHWANTPSLLTTAAARHGLKQPLDWRPALDLPRGAEIAPETVGTRVERFDRRGTEPFEPFEPFEFFQNRNFP